MNRAEFRAGGLQGRSGSIEMFEPINRWERLKQHLPGWLRGRFPPRQRSVGWRGRSIGRFLSSEPVLSHRLASRRTARGKIERMVTGRPVRVPGRSRRKRAEARLRAQGAI